MKKPTKELIPPSGVHLILLDDVFGAIQNIRDRAQTECDQSLLNHSLEDARWALAERDACDRVAREVKWIAERSIVKDQTDERREPTAA